MPASAPPEASTSITDTPPDVAYDAGPAVGAEFEPRAMKLKLIAACAIGAAGALIALIVAQRADRKTEAPGPGDGPGTAAVSVLPGTTWSAQPPTGPPPGPTPGPDPAAAAIEAQAAEWLALLQEGIAKHPGEFDAHLEACDILLKRFPETLAAQKARGLRSDLKARRNSAARAALDQVLAAQDGLLSMGEVGEAIMQMAEMAELHAGTPAAVEADAHLRKLEELKIVRLADIRRASGEAEDDEDYGTAIAHWKRALKLGDDDITAEARLQIERLEGLRRFAETAAALRAQRDGRNHLHNFAHGMLEQTLAERGYPAALQALRAFAETAEAEPVRPRVDREIELVARASDCFEAAERALAERVGKGVALRKRGVTDRLISGQLRSFTDGLLKVQLGGTAGAMVALPSRDLALEDILRLGGHTAETAEGRFAEAALRYCDNDLPGARSALAAAAEAGMPVEQPRRDLEEFVAWRLLQAARRHWIAEDYRKAGRALEQLQRRHGESTLFSDYEEEIRGRAQLAPSYEERAEAVELFRKAPDPQLFGDTGTVAVVGEEAPGPPHLEMVIGGIEFGGKKLPNWFLMAGDIDAKPWAGHDGGHSGPPGTGLLFEPRWLGEFPVRARVTFKAAGQAPAGVLFSLCVPLAGKGEDHVPLRVVVGDEGSVLILQDVPHQGEPANLLRLDGLKLGDGESHTIDVTLGSGRVSVSVDGSPVRSAPAASRRGGHLQLEGHGDKLRYQKVALTARLDPWWVLNDRKVRRLLTVRKR
ncbi:MAG: hypothetical protein ACYTGX_04670 [Planctomycetota bacterium]